jgi:extracellular matrix regulatory protein A
MKAAGRRSKLITTAMSVGFGNYVIRERIIAILSSGSAPVKRSIQEARKEGQLIDATQGRRTKSVLFIDNGQMVISALGQETLAKRIATPASVPEGENGELE